MPVSGLAAGSARASRSRPISARRAAVADGVDVSLVVEDDAVDALGDLGVEDAPLDVGPNVDRIAVERIAEATAGRAPELEDVVGSELDAGRVRGRPLR